MNISLLAISRPSSIKWAVYWTNSLKYAPGICCFMHWVYSQLSSSSAITQISACVDPTQQTDWLGMRNFLCFCFVFQRSPSRKTYKQSSPDDPVAHFKCTHHSISRGVCLLYVWLHWKWTWGWGLSTRPNTTLKGNVFQWINQIKAKFLQVHTGPTCVKAPTLARAGGGKVQPHHYSDPRITLLLINAVITFSWLWIRSNG